MDAIPGRAATSPARQLASFTACLTLDEIPTEVLERTKLLILDALGVGLASSVQEFAAITMAGVLSLGGPGPCSVIGRWERLPVRDAALANGVLIHGLDFDDTHLVSIVHPTAACLPCALSLGEHLNLDGGALLTAYVAGMETAIRIGAAVAGGFHHAGFHATGIVAHFSSCLVAGKLLGLDIDKLIAAQGIAASTASGVQVFLEEGAWTKRLHPAWAAVAGITAAHLAAAGFVGPTRPYEGRFGLLETHLQQHAAGVDQAALSAGLGTWWRLTETAIKPYPACHFIHGCADAAIALHDEIDPADIEALDILLPRDTLPIVAEPIESKRRPMTDYDAKFSAPFVVATCLRKGRFGLAELLPEALADTDVRALSFKASCAADPDTKFPTYFSGAVRLAMRDGSSVFRHVPVNTGAGERAMGKEGVVAKFMASAEVAVPRAHAERIRDAVLRLEAMPVRELAALLRQDGDSGEMGVQA